MTPDAEDMTVAVVGLGLMGSSIVANFLIAGHKVIGLTPMPQEFADATNRIQHHLTACEELDLLENEPDYYSKQLHITQGYADLHQCDLVLECVVEDLKIKSEVIGRIEKNVSSHCIIASNTSAIPITTLQEKVKTPGRFLGLHWAEPAYGTRFLEVICGAQTDIKIAEQIQLVGTRWGKEPILVKKDIRGFVTNRLMYAVYREGLHILGQGEADLEALDKAFRYDTGSWITMMGIFQRMDYLGVTHFASLAERTFEQLNNTKQVPQIMKKLVQEKGRGIHNQNGLYPYTNLEAREWKEAFEKFSGEIYQLSSQMDKTI